MIYDGVINVIFLKVEQSILVEHSGCHFGRRSIFIFKAGHGAALFGVVVGVYDEYGLFSVVNHSPGRSGRAVRSEIFSGRAVLVQNYLRSGVSV